MSTEIDPTGGRLVAWAQAANAANQLAAKLVTTDFVPKRIINKTTKEMGPISVDDCTAMILMGDELGLTPLAAMNAIYIVRGKPGLYTRSMLALALSRGHEIWTEKSSDNSVTVSGRRKGSDHIETSTWTTERAKIAGYTQNSKYQSHPQEMLFAKAAAEVARKIAADVLMGITYSVEELELDEETTTNLVHNSPASRQIVRKNLKKEKVEILAPSFDSPTAPAIENSSSQQVVALQSDEEEIIEESSQDGEHVAPASAAQIKKIAAQMRELRMSDREIALSYVSDVIGRTVKSRNELNLLEASQVIEALDVDIRVNAAIAEHAHE